MELLAENHVLRTALETNKTVGTTGREIALHSGVKPQFADALYRMILLRKPAVCVEIGMAHGISSLAILTALNKIGQGKLISIDPAQSSQWEGSGVMSVERAGFSALHKLIEKPDFVALPELAAASKIDFAYIDGWHTFDYTLLDAFYLDKMLKPGGILAFNDCAWPAVHKSICCFMKHRRYREIDAGLERQYVYKGHLGGLLRRIKGVSRSEYYPQINDRYFEKLENWEPRWDFHAEF